MQTEPTFETEGTAADVALRLVVAERPVEGLPDVRRQSHRLILVEPRVGKLEALGSVLARAALALGHVHFTVLA